MPTKTKTQAEKDKRIQKLDDDARNLWPKIEKIIDELKGLGPHSLDGDNTLMNVREWLQQLSRR